MHTCTKCKKLLPRNAFYDNRHVPSGRQSHCKDCTKQSTYEWRRKNPERRRQQSQKYFYGVSSDDLGTACQVCGSTELLAVDHDHSCCPGQKTCGDCVRGVLCKTCNVGLGMFQDDPLLLLKAAAYLANTYDLEVS